MVYLRATLDTTWFTGIWIMWYCNLRVQTVLINVYVTLFTESQFGMSRITEFCLFKGRVFCQLFKQSTRQILKNKLRIFRRLSAYEKKISIFREQIVVRRPEVSSLAILSGRVITHNTVRSILYRLIG